MNLSSLYIFLISLCDSNTKNQVESTNEFPDLEKKMDSFGRLNFIKKLVYTSGTNDLNIKAQQGYGQHQSHEPSPTRIPVYTRHQGSIPGNEKGK